MKGTTMFDHSPVRGADVDRDSHDGCDVCAAYKLGVEAAQAAASWAADGNTDAAAIARLLEMMEAGDPALEQYLPPTPDLSGEWADGPTPTSLALEVTSIDPDDDDESWAATVDALADAWEQGVADTFEQACEAELRRHVA